MNHIVRYYPGFVDEPEVLEEEDFETTEQLLAIEWISRWETLNPVRFIRFGKIAKFIAAEIIDELNGEPREYILGTVKDIHSVDLPWLEYDRR